MTFLVDIMLLVANLALFPFALLEWALKGETTIDPLGMI